MAKIRRLTLGEWFLNYQLSHSWFSYHHLPFHLDIDVTPLVERAESLGYRFSPTATVVKAAALLLKERPQLNRMLFHTLTGMRIAEFETIRVNMPVVIENNNDPVLSAMVFEGLLDKTVPEIHQEIRAFSQSDLSDKPIGRFVNSRGNHWWNRLFLRFIHFVAHRIPKAYATKGGGISVTSLMRRNVQGIVMRGTAIGQTALTFLVNNLQKTPEGRYILYVGVDNNHSVLEGDEYSEACSVFAQIIGEPDLDLFYPKGQPFVKVKEVAK